MIQLELRHFRSQWRLLTVLLCLSFISDMLDPALLIFGTPASLTTKAAGLTGYPYWVAMVFLAGAVLLVPHMAAGAIAPPGRYERITVQLACVGLCLGAVVWLLLGYLSRNLDAGPLSGIYLRNCLVQLGFAAVMATSINNKQIRDAERERIQAEEGGNAT